jgi:hypothetical protein
LSRMVPAATLDSSRVSFRSLFGKSAFFIHAAFLYAYFAT